MTKVALHIPLISLSRKNSACHFTAIPCEIRTHSVSVNCARVICVRSDCSFN